MSTRHNTEQGIDMAAVTSSQTLSARAVRAKLVAYWIVTGLLAAELVLGGIWDVLRIPLVRDAVTHLGYPTYFLVLLGIWKYAELPHDHVAAVVQHAYARFNQSTLHDFVPLLVERRARKELAKSTAGG